MQQVYLPEMLFLIKTKKKDGYVRSVGLDFYYDDMCIISPDGLSGSLVVYWNNFVSVRVISSDARLLDLYVEDKSFNFYTSCVYGHPIPKQRHYLWEKLQRLSINRDEPWLICEDFNEILDQSEKQGGRIRNAGSLKQFRTMIDVCKMKELDFKGNQFSWIGRRRKEVVQVCLDHVLSTNK